MHKDGFEKHVAILSGCQVLYLKDSQIDKLTYNGSQLHRDMVISLANNNPNIKYYVIGTCLAARTKNDAIETTNKLTKGKQVKLTSEKNLNENKKLLKSVFKYYDDDESKSNIVFLTENYFRFHGDDTSNKEQVEYKLNSLIDFLRKEEIDYGVIKGGLFNGHVPYLVPKPHMPFDENGNINYNGKCATVENNAIYSIYVVNNLNFPYITINDDDNFCGLRTGKKINKNIINPEVANINMYNGFNEYELFKDADAKTIANNELVKYKVPVIFKEGMDAILLKTKALKELDRDKINIDEKKSMFVYINFREKNKIRYERFINYILYNDLKCDKIIWSNLYEFKPKETEEGLFNEYKDVLFENKGHKETMEQLIKSKYTFCCSVFEKQFCIGRFWEAVYCKTIPFIHRISDKNNELVSGIGSKEWVEIYNIPEYLFVSSPEELKEKIYELETNEDKYKEVLDQINSLYKREYSEEIQINNIIMDTVKTYIK